MISGSSETFWVSDVSRVGVPAVKRSVATGEAKIAGSTGEANLKGKVDVACLESKAIIAAAYVVCPTIVNAAYNATPALKQAVVVGRIVWRSGKYNSDASTTIDSHGDSALTDAVKPIPIVHVNTDLILASLYQSNDSQATPAAPDGTKWCAGAWSNSLSSEVTVKAQKGLGATTKCSFQFVATSATKAPAFELGGNPAAFTFLV